MNKKLLITVQLVAIILVTAAAFSPALKNGFTNWDDPNLLIRNTHIRSLTTRNLTEFFTSSFGGFGGYTPLVFTSYALEYRFFGLDPKAYHVTNILLHLMNTLLVYIVIFLFTRKVWVSFIIAMIFGVHPVHVEAVAWIQGRKDLLFSLFYLLGIVSYVSYLRKNKRASLYALAFLCFMLSLLSKVTAVSFPLVVLLIEMYSTRQVDKGALKRVAPFIAFSGLFLIVSFVTNGINAGQSSRAVTSSLDNIVLFFYSFAFYVGKIVFPTGLIARYSVHVGQYPWQMVRDILVFGAFCGVAYFTYRRQADRTTLGIGFFILTLLPTLFFHFAGQPYADRYMYLPIIGFLMVCAAALEYLDQTRSQPGVMAKYLLCAFAGLVILLLGGQSFKLSRVWHDSLTLWNHVIKVDPKNATAYLVRAEALGDSGRTDDALKDYAQAISLSPEDPDIYVNRGSIYFDRGELDSAMKDYDKALSYDAFYYAPYISRGILWGRLRDFKRAVVDLSTALALNKRAYQAYYYRGLAYKELNKTSAAISDLEEAYKISPSEKLRAQIDALKRSNR